MERVEEEMIGLGVDVELDDVDRIAPWPCSHEGDAKRQ